MWFNLPTTIYIPLLGIWLYSLSKKFVFIHISIIKRQNKIIGDNTMTISSLKKKFYTSFNYFTDNVIIHTQIWNMTWKVQYSKSTFTVYIFNVHWPFKDDAISLKHSSLSVWFFEIKASKRSLIDDTFFFVAKYLPPIELGWVQACLR